MRLSLKVDPSDLTSGLSLDDLYEVIKACENQIKIIEGIKLNDAEMRLLDKGNKVQAIKSLYRRTNFSIRQAKEAVDAHYQALRNEGLI